jgi:hypothetical protein
MSLSRGPVSFQPLFTSRDIGVRDDAVIEHVIKTFLHVGEAIAERWIEMPNGVLLLQSVSGRSDSGAIYLYDRVRQVFFFANFAAGRDDSFTVIEFDDLVNEYDLVAFAARPCSLSTSVKLAHA